jgi:hypothetical protein
MFRFAVVLAVAMMTANTLFAQKTVALAGIWGGFGVASSTNAKGRLSYGLGADLSLNFGMLSLVTRPALDRRGYGGSSNNGGLKANVSYLDIPVLLEISFGDASPSAVFVGAGGYYGLAFSGNLRYANGDKKSFTFGEDSTNNRSRTDKGVVLTGGRQFKGGAKAGIQLMFSTDNVIPEARQKAGNDQRLSALYFFFSIPLNEFVRRR